MIIDLPEAIAAFKERLQILDAWLKEYWRFKGEIEEERAENCRLRARINLLQARAMYDLDNPLSNRVLQIQLKNAREEITRLTKLVEFMKKGDRDDKPIDPC